MSLLHCRASGSGVGEKPSSVAAVRTFAPLVWHCRLYVKTVSVPAAPRNFRTLTPTLALTQTPDPAVRKMSFCQGEDISHLHSSISKADSAER